MLQDTRPGWLYEVKKGATTIWETWDGINEKGEVKASLNHYSYGAICGWILDAVCGIQVSDGKIRICPHPDKVLGYAKLPISRHMAELKAAGNMMGTKSHMSLKSRQIRMQR